MGLTDLFRRAVAPRPGTVYNGPASFFNDVGVVPWPGFYALDDEGKNLRLPPLRLVAVDDAPGDPDDGAWHLEVAGPNDPAQRPAHIVALEMDAAGRAEVTP